MLEPLRSRYLAALGVDVYVPRAILPAAKCSDVCVWDEAAFAEASPVEISAAPGGEALAQKTAVRARAPIIDVERKSAAPIVVREAARRAESAAPKFALSIVLAANGVLLIDDAPASSAARHDYQRLLGNFLKAVNKDPQFDLDIFFWPMHKNPSIAQDEAAAKETLAAYLHKQIQQRAIHTVLLLGAAAQQWVSLDETLLRSIRSNSLLACLHDSSLKRQLWSDVRELSER